GARSSDCRFEGEDGFEVVERGTVHFGGVALHRLRDEIDVGRHAGLGVDVARRRRGAHPRVADQEVGGKGRYYNKCAPGLGASHSFSRPSGRTTGMRSWMWLTASFALVVRIAKLTGLLSAVAKVVGSRWMPAMAKGSPDFSVTR